MVPPLTPFFPAAYHTDSDINSRSRWNRRTWWRPAFKDAPTWNGKAAADGFAGEQRRSTSSGTPGESIWIPAGRTWESILSPAPSGDVSIGAAIEI